MKTFVLFVCVLAVATAVYGADVEKIKEYHNSYAACAKDLGAPLKPIRADVFACTAKKEGSTIDEQGKAKKDKVMDRLEQLISDPNKLGKAKKDISKCLDDAYQGAGTIQEQTMRSIECSLPSLALID